MRNSKVLVGWAGSMICTMAVVGQITFAPVELYDAGDNPRAIQAADLNLDGYPELIVLNDSGIFSLGRFVVLYNDGTGRFGAPVGYGATDEYPTGLGVTDIDRDGDLDIVVGTSATAYLYKNDGTGHFQERDLGEPANAIDFAFLDYNGDGWEDLGAVTYYGDVVTMRNEGGGYRNGEYRHIFDRTFAQWPTAIDAVDLDGDGVNEFVVASHSPRTFVRLEWTAQDRFNPIVSHDVGRVDSVAYADLDGEPGLDALITHNAGNDGSPSPGIWIDCNTGAGNLDTCARIRKIFPSVMSPEAVAAADFDSNGSDEIVVSDSFFSQSVAVASRSGATWALVAQPDVGGSAYSVLAVDLDEDGKADIVTANRFGSVGVLRNTSN